MCKTLVSPHMKNSCYRCRYVKKRTHTYKFVGITSTIIIAWFYKKDLFYQSHQEVHCRQWLINRRTIKLPLSDKQGGNKVFRKTTFDEVKKKKYIFLKCHKNLEIPGFSNYESSALTLPWKP